MVKELKKNELGTAPIFRKLEEYQQQMTSYLNPLLKFLKTWA